MIKKWEPEEFQLETNTVWSFPERGDWATHDSKWRGNWSPYIPRNIILRYSKEKDLILDQFAGGGTTLVEAKLLNRDIIGVDINDTALARCKEKVSFHHEGANGKVYLHKGDACCMDFIPDDTIELICTHPPYADIIRYSKNIKEDISSLDYEDFLYAMDKVSSEAYRVLKRNCFCVFLIGDIRKEGYVKPLGLEVMKIFEKQGFKLKEIIIKQQHNCKMTPKWEKISAERNFLLLAHEYIFVMKK